MCSLLGYRLALRLSASCWALERGADRHQRALCGATSGMEVALVSVLILATLVAFERSSPRGVLCLRPL